MNTPILTREIQSLGDILQNIHAKSNQPDEQAFQYVADYVLKNYIEKDTPESNGPIETAPLAWLITIEPESNTELATMNALNQIMARFQDDQCYTQNAAERVVSWFVSKFNQ
jgi:hypothetical protein